MKRIYKVHIITLILQYNQSRMCRELIQHVHLEFSFRNQIPL